MFSSHLNCLLCQSPRLKPLKGYEKDYLVKCSSCAFVFCSRIPTVEELTTHYKKYKRGGEISAITIKRYDELLDRFETFRKNNNILDIGCGDGYFLEVAKKRGWNVYGTEFTDEAIAVCHSKGINMQKGVLDPTNYKNINFDVVTSFEVIEHINNPVEEIGNIKSILRENGALYITTPNFNSVSRFFLGPKWNVIEYPEHLSYYTPKTLTHFLKKHNFTKAKIETTGIHIRRFNQSVNSGAVTNTEETLREKTETRLVYKMLKKSVNTFLNITTSGDNLKALFINNKS